MGNTSRQFNLIIAYLVPGFIGLAGLIPIFPIVGTWLQPVHQGDLGFGPPIYALLSAVAVGLIVSCFRWVLLDQLHHWTGIRAPSADFGRLRENLEGLDYLAQNHYRYYEFAANTLLAVLWTYAVHRIRLTTPILGTGTDLGMAILSLVLFVASRDALSKYFLRVRQLLGEAAEKGSPGDGMYNGIGHHDGGGSSKEVAPKPEKQAQPQGKDEGTKKVKGDSAPRASK